MAQINPVENTSNVWKKALTGGDNIIAGGSIEVSDITNKLDTLSDKGGLNVVKPTGKILIKQGFVDGADNIRGSELVYDLSTSPFSASDWLITLEGQIKAGEPDLATVKRVLLLLTEDRELATGNFVCVYQKSDNKLYIVASDGTHTLSETVIYDTALLDDTTYTIALGFNGEKFRCQVDGGAWTYVTKSVGYDPVGLRYAGWGFIPVLDSDTKFFLDTNYGQYVDKSGDHNLLQWWGYDAEHSGLQNKTEPGSVGACLDDNKGNNGAGVLKSLSNITGYTVIALLYPDNADEPYLRIGGDDFKLTGATPNKWVVDINKGAGVIGGRIEIFGNNGAADRFDTLIERFDTSTKGFAVRGEGKIGLIIIKDVNISSAVEEQVQHGLISGGANIEIDRMIIK